MPNGKSREGLSEAEQIFEDLTHPSYNPYHSKIPKQAPTHILKGAEAIPPPVKLDLNALLENVPHNPQRFKDWHKERKIGEVRSIPRDQWPTEIPPDPPQTFTELEVTPPIACDLPDRPRPKESREANPHDRKRKFKHRDGTSKFYGVSRLPKQKAGTFWEFSIWFPREKRRFRQGHFLTEEDAARAYDHKVLELGLARPLNFPEDCPQPAAPNA